MLEQAQLDFDARMPIAAHEDAPGRAAASFGIGEHVFLKGAQYSGQPGRVLRHERMKVVVYWADLDYIARHVPASLMLAEVAKGGL